MKYIIICIVALGIAFFVGYLITRLIRKIRKSKKSALKTVVSTIVIGVVIMLVAAGIYLGTYNHADDKAMAAMEGNENVSVKEIDGGYYFDGPGDKEALVFYQGAKVDEKAYAPLMLKIAEGGTDCFLAKMPFRFAIFGGDTADKFIEKYDYESWIMCGHSMGGMMASSYTAERSDKIDALVLLASYPIDNINDNIVFCSIYGSCDTCLDKEEYEKGREDWPAVSSEHCIEGGNHAGFGNYGAQSGDTEATISSEEQQRITANIINDLKIILE